ncbi:MAG: (d)CMP kinase [bacterium]
MKNRKESAKKNIIIAIDGPAGSGKSTTAQMVAKRLNISYIDSGAFYRAYTLQILQNHISLQDETAIDDILAQTHVMVQTSEKGTRVELNGRDVSKEIRSPEVTAYVSSVSKHPKVRQAVTQKLWEIAENKSIILEGRDIGTKVFPNADLKIYLEASIQARAERRHHELVAAGMDSDKERMAAEIAARDKQDSERILSPLMKADDAVILNNTNLSIEESVNFIVQKALKFVN